MTIVIFAYRFRCRCHSRDGYNDRFRGFCQFCMEKKEFAVEMKTLYDFPNFLMHIRPFGKISNHNKTNLTWHLHV